MPPINEANAIGTAMLRTSLYPDSVQLLLKTNFKLYLEQRIAFFEVGANYDSAFYWVGEAEKTGNKLWVIASEYAKASQAMVPTSQMIPAMNAMLDLATIRHYTLISKVPESILYLLFLLSIVSAFFAGFSRKKERINKLISVIFCLITAAVVYTTLDLDRPRRGFIRLDETHNVMTDLRKMLAE